MPLKAAADGCTCVRVCEYLTDDPDSTVDFGHVTQQSRTLLRHDPQRLQEADQRGGAGLGHVHQRAEQGLRERLVRRVTDQRGHLRTEHLHTGRGGGRAKRQFVIFNNKQTTANKRRRCLRAGEATVQRDEPTGDSR